MGRKNRVCLITLIVLLVASLIGLFMVKKQWDASESNYVAANDQLSEAQASSEALRTELDSANSEIDTLTADIEAKNAEIETLKTELDSTGADLTTAQETVAALQTQVDQLSGLADETADANARILDLQTALDAANEKAAVLNGEIEATQADNAAANETIAALQAALDTANSRVVELSAVDPSAANDSIEELSSALILAEEKANALETALENAQTDENIDIEADLAELQSAILTAEIKAAEVSDSLNALKGEVLDADRKRAIQNASDRFEIYDCILANRETEDVAFADALEGAKNASRALEIMLNGEMSSEEDEAILNAALKDAGLDTDAETALTLTGSESAQVKNALNALFESRLDALETAAGDDAVGNLDHEALSERRSELGILDEHTALESALAQIDSLNTLFSGNAEAETSLEELRTKLTIAQTALEEIEERLADSNREIAVLEAQVVEMSTQDSQSSAEIASLTQQLSEAKSTSESLSEQLAQAQTDSSTVNTSLEEAQAKIAELEAQLSAAQSESEALSAELESLREQYAAAQSESESEKTALLQRIELLEAYLLERELGEGEAHSSITAATVIRIGTDGISGEWAYTNNLVSGNSVVLSIEMNGTELFRSETLAPGETLNAVRLNTALEAGSYEAVSVTAIYEEDGTYLFANRVPVTLVVADK